MSDVHLTRLAGWVVQQFGRALVWSILVALVIALIAAASSTGELVWVASIASPLTFGLVLSNASAPLPYTAEELGLEGDHVDGA